MTQPVDWLHKSGHGQSVDLDIGEMMEDYKVHVRVHLDSSYAWQSWAHLDVWCEPDLSWHRVADLLPGMVHDLYEAAEELRARAAAILLDAYA